MADQFSVMIDYPANGGDEETEVKCLGDFAYKYDAEGFRKRIARVLDTGDDLPVTALCLWEVILHIRGSNNPGSAVVQAHDSGNHRHGTYEMRRVMTELDRNNVRKGNRVLLLLKPWGC